VPSTNDMRFDQQVAVITGAGGGLGKQTPTIPRSSRRSTLSDGEFSLISNG
jgi:hypothetical protein